MLSGRGVEAVAVAGDGVGKGEGAGAGAGETELGDGEKKVALRAERRLNAESPVGKVTT